MDKVKIGTCWLDGCSGCHMSILDMDESIVDVLSKYGLGIGLEKLFPGRARFRLPTSGTKSDASTIYERIRLRSEERRVGKEC